MSSAGCLEAHEPIPIVDCSTSYRLVPQTLLLAVLLASLALVPAAVCLGPNVQDLVAVLINLR